MTRGRIFLSYGRADARSIAEQLEADLRREGFEVWRDVNSLRTAAGWDAQIEAAIRQSDVMLALLSPHATRRQSESSGAISDSVCLDEIAYARFGPSPVPVVPIMVKETSPPLILIRQQWLDLTAGSSSPEYPQRLSSLVSLIEAVMRSGRPPIFDDLEADIFDIDYLIPSQAEYFVPRAWLRRGLQDWIVDQGRRKVMLITGEPGIGKSTFFADYVSKNPDGRVVAYHACRQSRSDTLQAGRALRSMASMVSRMFTAQLPLLAELSRAGRPLSLNEALSHPQRAFDEGLLKLLASVDGHGPIAIFIDSLDESLLGPRPSLAEILANSIDLLPRNVRLVATTRAIPGVLDLFRGELVSHMETQSRDNLEDIRTYIGRRMTNAENRGDAPQTTAIVERRSGGNFLVAKLLVDEVLETGKVAVDPGAELAPLSGIFTRAFARRFPAPQDYEPVRKILALVAAIFEPIPAGLAIHALELGSRHDLFDALGPAAPYVLRDDGTLASFHLSFFEWLVDPANRYGVDIAEGHRTALVAFAALVRKMSNNERVDSAEKEYFGKYLLNHLAASSQYLDGEIPVGVLAALGFGLVGRRGAAWPDADNVPKDYTKYVEFISQSKNAEAAVLLVSVLHEMVLNLYVESGVLKPLHQDGARFEITSIATNGAAVAAAFEVAGTMAAIARTFHINGVFAHSRKSSQAVAGFLQGQAYYAGGFHIALWARDISAYFEDSGQALYGYLHEVRELLQADAGGAS